MNATFTAAVARKSARTAYAGAAALSGVKDTTGAVVAYTFAIGTGEFGFVTAAGTLGRLGWDRADAARRALDSAAGVAPLDIRVPGCPSGTELLAVLSDNPNRDLCELLLPRCADDCAGVAFRSDYRGICRVQAAVYDVYNDGVNAAGLLARAERNERRGKTVWAANLRRSVAQARERTERVVSQWSAELTCEHVMYVPFGE